MSSREESLQCNRKEFWDSIAPSIEGMMQTDNAETVAHVDTFEIMSYLPDCRRLKVLDLGAGIGRFTTKFAELAHHITAVDISQSFIDQNKEINKNFTNITYICKDITEIDFSPGSFHLVFSSWILKYLNDDEVAQVMSRILTWVIPGGYFFFRESCFHEIGTVNLAGNPTIFRPMLHYCEILRSVSAKSVNFRLLRGRNAQSYLQFQGAPNQFCFLAERSEDDQKSDLERLLESRYSLQNIKMMEKLYGSPWLHIGRESTAKDLYDDLYLRPRQRILDIGCTTGSSAFFIAKQYRSHVHGIDFSVAGINLAIERQMKLDKDLRKLVQFEVGDILKMEFEEGYFDVIYSRESFLYIPNKKQLFSKIYRWLRPGGILFFTDVLKGSSPPSKSCLEYLETIKPCFPVTADSYKQTLESMGFQNAMSLNYGEKWIKILENDLRILTSTHGEVGGDVMFYDYTCDISKKKMEWIKERQLTWGIFRATK